jgi:phytoene dehydrogenase-like protein
MGGMPGQWGYIRGGMGMVSFLIADAAREAGVEIRTGVEVGSILPGRGVRLASGEYLEARVVISNADPRVTLKLLGSEVAESWREKVEKIPIEGCTLKLNVWLRELPDFKARPGQLQPHHFGQVNTPLTKAQWKDGYAAARSGKLPERLWTELYFQSVHDTSVCPDGTHTMSVFSQYVPYSFREGDWDLHRDAARDLALRSIEQYCPNIPAAVIGAHVLGPPDIEREVGLTGGHIFQGECLPAYMWSNRLQSRTPMPGFYMCGASTHPGGSVIAANGRNAAMAVLQDQG